MTEAVYTVGHSTHPIESFIALLKAHAISAVGDVRSRPYSRMNPQFNREELKKSLAEVGIRYVFLGKELGARSEDRSCYRHGQVQYDLLAKTALFREGIERVKEGAKQYRIALMCAEKEPLDCHRTILVARELLNEGFHVKHILYNAQVEDHQSAMERLVKQLRVPAADMFREPDKVIKDAYAQRANEIAYREDNVPSTNDPSQPYASRIVE